MKGYIAVKGFKHGRHYKAGDKVDISDYVNRELVKKGLIEWVERPKIIMPKKEDKPKIKKRVSKSKNKN